MNRICSGFRVLHAARRYRPPRRRPRPLAEGPVIVTSGEGSRQAGAGSRLGADQRRVARQEPARGAEAQRRRDDGGAAEAEGRRASRPTRSRRAATICSRSSTTRTASRRCAATSPATASRCGSTSWRALGEMLEHGGRRPARRRSAACASISKDRASAPSVKRCGWPSRMRGAAPTPPRPAPACASTAIVRIEEHRVSVSPPPRADDGDAR